MSTICTSKLIIVMRHEEGFVDRFIIYKWRM